MSLVADLSLWAIAWAPPTQAAAPPADPTAIRGELAWGDCPLPAQLLRRLDPLRSESLYDAVLEERSRHPELYGVTAPPAAPVVWPGEYTPRSALVLAWPGDPSLDRVALSLAMAAAPVALVRILVEEAAARDAQLALRLAGLDAARVELMMTPTDSLWLRDFGPVFVHSDGELVAIDAIYLPDCLHDEAAPTRIAPALGAASVARSPLQMMGGSLITDGAGTCFTTPALAAANGVADWATDGGLQRWYGCEQVLTLPALQGGAIDHIDLMLSVADAHTLLLGESDPESDPVNHAVLEEAARRLADARALDGAPYRIVRVPMVPLDPTVTTEGLPMVRTWLNLVPLNGRVLVPAYSRVDPALQEDAWDRIAAAFPDRELVAIYADAPASMYGALRCLTVTVPAPTPPTPASPRRTPPR